MRPDDLAAIIAAAVDAVPPLRSLDDLPGEQASYLRRVAELRGITEDELLAGMATSDNLEHGYTIAPVARYAGR